MLTLLEFEVYLRLVVWCLKLEVPLSPSAGHSVLINYVELFLII